MNVRFIITGAGAAPLGGGFSFGASTGSAAPSGGFSFKPGESSCVDISSGCYHVKCIYRWLFILTAIAQASAGNGAATAGAGDEEEEYVPPKAEVENKITEDDALYTKRYDAQSAVIRNFIIEKNYYNTTVMLWNITVTYA